MRRMAHTTQPWSWRRPIALATVVFFLAFTIVPSGLVAETITLEGGTVDVTVQDNTTNWNVTGNPVWSVPEFNIAEGSTYNIAGLGSGSSLALLVNGGQASNIFGTMNLSNLAFILQNVYGINIGATGIVNLNNASLIASTLPLNLNATDFLKQNYQFSGQGGFLTNDGKIIGNNADLVALVANAIENKGTIEVPMGTVALAAGDMVSIGISPDGLISIAVDETAINAMGLSSQIRNAGAITADGGRVILNAKAIDGLFDRAISLDKNASAVSAIRADNGIIEFVSIDDIYNEALVRATDGQIKIDSVQGDVVNAGTMEAIRGSIDINAAGTIETRGILRTETLRESGYTFKIGGIADVGRAYMDNRDGAATIESGAQLAGEFTDGGTDGGNIIVQGDFSLLGDTLLWADHVNNGTGAIQWSEAYTLTGNNHNLTLKASQDSTVGAITGVNLLTLDKNAGKTPTYTGSTADDISVNTIRTELGTVFTKDVTDGEGNHLIYSVSDAIGGLQYMGHDATTLDFNYKMANNIDASETVDWNGSLGFDPVGDISTKFTGNFDGNGGIISGFTINRSTEDNVGLFGYTNGVTIQNVGLVSGSVVGKYFIGGLVGYSDNSSITNSYTTGNITGSVWHTGGLVGYSSNSSITNSYATGSITGGTSYAGGLVGYSSHSSIVNSYATGNVTGQYDVGGLVGINDNASTTNSYATGNVTGNSGEVGGLAGRNYDSSSITDSYAIGRVTGGWDVGGLVGFNAGSALITNSYAMGDVTSSGYHVGGLVGYNAASSIITNSYAVGDVLGSTQIGGLVGWNHYYSSVTNSYAIGSVSGVDVVGGLVGENSMLSTVSNSYFTDNAHGDQTGKGTYESGGIAVFFGNTHAVYSGWTFGDGNGGWDAFTDKLPHLDWEWSTNITTLLQLQNMSLNLAASYTLMNNIDASSTAYWNWDSGSSSYLGFDPVGQSDPFTGIFDGDSHIITGLTINRPEEWDVGLFGEAQDATFQNVGLEGGSVIGASSVGSLVGSVFNCSISNVYNTGSVEGRHIWGGMIGGLVGGAEVSTITSSYNTGTISGEADYVGGLVGGLVGNLLNEASLISNSYNTGAIIGNGEDSYGIGGLVGYLDWSASITGSYNTGSVSGSETSIGVGGLAGGMSPAGNDFDGTISNSYNTGSVAGGEFVGGLVGDLDGIISNSYNAGSVDGNDSVGGISGQAWRATITDSYNAGNVSGAQYVGGLIGVSDDSTILDSYSTGDINGGSQAGGLVGMFVGGSIMTNSFSTGVATSLGDQSGGLIGEYDSGTLTNNWWYSSNQYGIGSMEPTEEVEGEYQKANGIDDFYNPAHAVYDEGGANEWDFETVWRIYDGYTNPLLKSFLTALTVTANDATNIYNGTTTVAGNGVTYSVEPSAELLGTVTFTSPSKNVGTYAGGLTASGLYSTQQGYDITYVAGDLTITQASVTLSGITAENKVYDGTTDATVNTTGAIFTGMFAEDVLTVDSTGTFVDKEIGTDKTVNLANTFGGADLGNYAITDQATTTASILTVPEPPAPPAPPAPPPVDVIDQTLVTLPGVGGNEGTSPISGGTVLNPPPSGGNTDTGTGTGTGDTMGGVDLGMVFGSDSDTGLDLGTVMNIGDDASGNVGNWVPETVVEPPAETETVAEETNPETTLDPTGGTESVAEETNPEMTADQEGDAGTQESEVQPASSASELPDLSGTTRILELLEDYFSVQGAALLQTNVRVEEGVVYVVPADGKTDASLLEQGESMRVFYKEPETRDPRSEAVEPSPAAKTLTAAAPVSPAKPKTAPATEQRVMKPAMPVVMEQSKGGTRYGVLKNPSRNVFVKSHGGDWQAASDGMVILPGDEVKTASSASVNVSLEGGKVGLVEIKEGSLFRINKAETDLKTGDKMTLLDLAIGKVMIHAGKLQGASKFEVRTPTALTGVRGTVFEVTVKEKA